LKTKRESVSSELKEQVEWAETIPDDEITMMLLDGKSKTTCGCDVIGDDVCPHDNMGALHLLMLQFTEAEMEEMKSKAEEESK